MFTLLDPRSAYYKTGNMWKHQRRKIRKLIKLDVNRIIGSLIKFVVNRIICKLIKFDVNRIIGNLIKFVVNRIICK